MEQHTYTTKDHFIPTVQQVIEYFSAKGIQDTSYAVTWHKQMADKNWRFVSTGKKITNWNRIALMRIQDVLAATPQVNPAVPLNKSTDDDKDLLKIAEFIHKLRCDELSQDGGRIGYLPGFTKSVLELITLYKKKHEIASAKHLLAILISKTEGTKTYDYNYLEELLLV